MGNFFIVVASYQQILTYLQFFDNCVEFLNQSIFIKIPIRTSHLKVSIEGDGNFDEYFGFAPQYD